jgi:uncharacterized protein (TIGR02145 family)
MKKYFASMLMLMGSALIANAQNFKTIKIGSQVWMAENFDVDVPDSWYYNDDPSTASKYGRLYTWKAAIKASPPGWHLPTDKEWNQLIEYLGGEDTAGKQLKSGGSSGFNACLGGMSSVGSFRLLSMYGTFWSSTSYDTDHAWYFYITSNSSSVTRTYFSKNYGFSVRYVKNN